MAYDFRVTGTFVDNIWERGHPARLLLEIAVLHQQKIPAPKTPGPVETSPKNIYTTNNFPGRSKMNKLVIMSALLFVTLLMPVATATSQIATYRTGFQIQNLSGTEPAAITITYYNPDGTLYTSVKDTIFANASKTYYPIHTSLEFARVDETIPYSNIPVGSFSLFFPLQVSADFEGSLIITSNQPLAGITNILGDGLEFGASYEGFTTGSETVNLPLIMKGGGSGFHTWFTVQNTGSSPTNVTIAYAGTNCNDTILSLQPGAAARIDQTINFCLPPAHVGSATATADPGGAIVATVLEVGPDTLFAYNGFTSGSLNPALPLINFTCSGFITGVQLQNSGTSPTDVTLNYTPVSGFGTACSETKTVNPGQSETFALYAFIFPNDPNPGIDNCSLGHCFVGGATVTQSGSEPLAAISNQLNIATATGAAYNAFDPATASDTVVMPLIMDRNTDFWTGFNIQNVGENVVAITCNFVQANGSNHTTLTSPELGPGEAWNHLQLNQLGEGWVGSATCTGGADSHLLAIVNELQTGAPGDQFFAYTAFNQ